VRRGVFKVSESRSQQIAIASIIHSPTVRSERGVFMEYHSGLVVGGGDEFRE